MKKARYMQILCKNKKCEFIIQDAIFRAQYSVLGSHLRPKKTFL